MKPRSIAYLTVLFLLLTTVAAQAVTASDPRSEKIPITTDSEEVRALYAEGQLLIDSWRLDEALPIFERIVKLAPDFVHGWVGLAWSQPRFKDMFAYADRALALLDKVEISEAEEMQVRAFHASMNSDPQGWQQLTERLAARYPRDERAALQLGIVYRAVRNDREGALRQFRRATELNPRFVFAWRSVGDMEALLGRKEAAEAAYRHVIALAPDDPRSPTSLAEFLLQEGELDEALQLYDRALALRPLFEDAERGVVTVQMLQGRHEAARRHLREIYNEAPHDGFRSGIHFALAVTYADEGKYDHAVEELEKNLALSIKIHDSLAAAIDLSNMINMLLAAGRHDEAEKRNGELLYHILEDPSQPEARKRAIRATNLFRAGRIALHRGDLKTAAEQAEAFRRSAEELGQLQLQRTAHQLPGEIALAEERWDDAIRELTAANPDSAGNMFRIALAYRGKGDEKGYRRMLGYVVGYRGVLNLDYAKVRREAEERLREAAANG